MQLRTILAKDMKSALKEVRDTMGPDAVIVASERAKAGGVLVRAALDRREEEEPPAGQVLTGPDAAYHNTLIRRLREKPGAAPGRRRFDRGELLATLLRQRLPGGLAHGLAEDGANTGLGDMTLALAAALDKRMRPVPVDFATAKGILLLGPNGAGKTATAAKLAAHAQLAGRAVTLIAGDVSGAGAVARLKDFADHIAVRIVTADSAVSLGRAVQDAVDQRMIAIVDTAGFDPRLPKVASAFAALTKIEYVKAVGVVSAAMDSEEVTEIASALLALGAQQLIVTGADLARRAGGLAAAATAPGLELAHVTRSPFVAGGLETLSPLALSRLLVESDAGGAQ